MSQPVLRFAPSPNGLLHLGHAYSALLNQKIARDLGGRLVLRFDDNDRGRWRAEHEAEMLRDLEWIGFAWDGAPVRLSASRDACDAALARLEQDGLVFRSLLSRKAVQDIARRQEARHKRYGEPMMALDPDGVPLHPRVDAEIKPGIAFSCRLDMAASIAALGKDEITWRSFSPNKTNGIERRDPSVWGNAQLRNMNGDDAYAFATVLDDARLGVTHVVRGADLLENTSLQRLLQDCLGIEPPHYLHHALLLNEDGQKLSKSDGAQSLRALREAGWTRADVWTRLGLEQSLDDEKP